MGGGHAPPAGRVSSRRAGQPQFSASRWLLLQRLCVGSPLCRGVCAAGGEVLSAQDCVPCGAWCTIVLHGGLENADAQLSASWIEGVGLKDAELEDAKREDRAHGALGARASSIAVASRRSSGRGARSWMQVGGVGRRAGDAGCVGRRETTESVAVKERSCGGTVCCSEAG
ncbi:hypothetical protein DFH09DRAFT_1159163 [Mycena vulgaris]|nr:hypothetical protein DFH09DRAFT_1159163 [Mycena vulgaris]